MDNPYHFSHMNLVERIKKLNDSLNDKDISMKEKYHGALPSQEMDKEYVQLMNQKNVKQKSRVINLTSEKLKNEYTYKYNYFKSGIKFMFLLSIMIVTNTFIEFKYFGINEINISLLITSCISAGLCVALMVNINEKALLDTLGYAAFYLLSMIETVLFFFLFLIKLYDFINIINELYVIRNIIDFKNYSSFLFMIFFSVVNIIGVIFCFKFIYYLFFEGFDILIMKEKTIFQKQLELNKIEKNKRRRKIEFVDEESLDIDDLNSKDYIKID